MDIFAGTLELAGLWLIGNRNRLGFVLNTLGCALWVVVALRTGVYGLLLVVVPGMAVNLRNWRRWKARRSPLLPSYSHDASQTW